MSSKSNEQIRLLRLSATVNCFKSLLLGQLHVPKQSQSTAIFEKIYQITKNPKFTERTWERWFSKEPGTMQYGKARELDELTKRVSASEIGIYCKTKQTKQFFESMVNGGLVGSMLAPTRSADAKQVLISRAHKYVPATELHLHLDAIELHTIVDDFYDIPWQEVTKIASDRVFEVLFGRWDPRHGEIYPRLSSPLKLHWDAGDAVEREKIEESYLRYSPNLFERDYKAGAIPDWSRIGVESDIAPQHIYRTLFSIAADPDYLVADRLEAWFLDMATAALAMRALAWTDRFSTFAAKVTHEMLLWGAFDSILFSSDMDDQIIESAMSLFDAEWNEGSLGIFEKARDLYHRLLTELGIASHQVKQVVGVAEEAHPLTYIKKE